MPEKDTRSGPRQPKQYVTDADRATYRKEAEMEYRNIQSASEAEKALNKITNPNIGARGLRWFLEKLGELVNLAKVVVLSVFLGRQETSKRISAGNMEVEKQKQKDEAKKEIKTEVLKEKITQLSKEDKDQSKDAEKDAEKAETVEAPKKNAEPDLRKDESIEKTQFAMQVEHVSEVYKHGLTEFLETQTGLEHGKIAIGNFKDAEEKNWIQAQLTMSTGKILNVLIDERGQWKLPDETKADKSVQALAGEIRKAVTYYTGIVYDQIKDPEYNQVTRDVQKEDGSIVKEPLIGENFNRIPTGVSIPPKQVEKILNTMFEKGGIHKNRDFSIPLIYERIGDVVNVKRYPSDQHPLSVTKDNIAEMSERISRQAQKMIDNIHSSFQVSENRLQPFMEAADKAVEKQLEHDIRYSVRENLNQVMNQQLENQKTVQEQAAEHPIPEPQIDAAVKQTAPEMPAAEPQRAETEPIQENRDQETVDNWVNIPDDVPAVSELDDDGRITPYEREMIEQEAAEIISHSFEPDQPCYQGPVEEDPDLGT